jgi:hypothetical protein
MTGGRTLLEINVPSPSAYVRYSTVLQYNMKLLSVQNLLYKPEPLLQGGGGGWGAMSSNTVLHSCHPVTYKY